MVEDHGDHRYTPEFLKGLGDEVAELQAARDYARAKAERDYENYKQGNVRANYKKGEGEEATTPDSGPDRRTGPRRVSKQTPSTGGRRRSDELVLNNARQATRPVKEEVEPGLAEGSVYEAEHQRMMELAGMAPIVKQVEENNVLKTLQTIGRAAQNLPTRDSVRDEISQELRNFIRAQGGDPTAQNLSTLHGWQKKLEQDKQDKPDVKPPADGDIPVQEEVVYEDEHQRMMELAGMTPIVKGVAEDSLNEDPVIQFASKAHNEWRKNFDPTGTKERIKKNSDGTEGNINVPFEELHPDWKKENLAAGQAAMMAVKRFPNNIEQAAEYIHNEWMKRNPKADYNAAQHVAYDQLPEDEKEKDRVHVRTMMALSGKQGVAEGLDQPREADKAIQSLQNLAVMKSTLTMQQLSQAGREAIVSNAINAAKTLEQSYLQNKQQGNAIFVRALRDEIDNFSKGYPINSSMPETDTASELGDLLQGKLGKVNFQQGVAEGSEQISEYRDRLLQYVKSLLPNYPEYVLKDWLVPNKGNFSNLPDTELKNDIMEKLKGAGLTPNTKWQLVPNMQFTMDMFEPMSKQRLIGRAGGNSDMGLDVPRDKERHATQAALAQQQGGVRKEPVLLIKTDKGYELLEGWHRTIQHFAKYPDGYTGPAYVAVAQQGVAEGSVYEAEHQRMMELAGMTPIVKQV